jgi:hypothetical protein
VLALLAPAGAGAVGKGAVAKLRSEPCPPEYLFSGFEESVSAEEVQQARHNQRFRIAGKYVKLDPPINWRRNPVKSQTFRNSLVAMNWTKVLFKAYHDGDAGALDQARGVFLDFARHQRLGGRRTVDVAWGSKKTGDRGALMAYLARAAACTAGELSNGQAKDLLDSLAVHGREILSHGSLTNHGLFDAMGLAIIGAQLPFLTDAGKWRATARRRFEKILRKRIIGQEAYWLEHSAAYHIQISSLLERFLAIPGANDPGLQSILGRMVNVAGWLIEPDQRLVQFGDSAQMRPPDTYQDAAGNDSGLFALRRSGIAFVKAAGSYLATMTSFWNTTHKHSDELTFDLYEDGHRIVSDTGEYHKDRDKWFDFTRSSRAHSTLTVDGESFGRSKNRIYGSGILASGSGDGWHAIQSRNPILAKRTGVEHRRWLVYRPGVALFVVDRVRSGRSHRYERFLHLGPDLNIDAQSGFVGLSESSGQNFQGRVRDAGTSTATLKTKRAQKSPLAGWTSPAFRQSVPRWTLSYRERGTDEDWVTSISLDGLNDLRAAPVGAVTSKRVNLDLTGLLINGNLSLQKNGDSIAIDQTP